MLRDVNYARAWARIWTVTLVAALMGPSAGSAAAQAAAPQTQTLDTAPTRTPSCPSSRFVSDPDVVGMREVLLDPEGTSKLPAAMAKFGAKGPALLKEMREQREKDWPFLCRYREDNARIFKAGVRPQTIFIGDSITENWSYADPTLFAPSTLDRGISGQFSGQILLRFYQDAVALKPRVVHLMAGTNDLGQEGNAAFSDDDIVNNLRAMIDIAKANGIRVVLASILPAKAFLLTPNARPAQRIVTLNQRLKQLARERHVVFADYHAVLADADGFMRPNLTSDGVHPNRVGYELMRPLAERAVRQALR